MAYLLGNKVLPEPKSIEREVIETAVENISLTGITTKRISNRKERFILTFQNLTQTQVNELFSEYDLNTVRTFQVTDTGMEIAATDVFIDLPERVYNKTGLEYREDIQLILTEVS